MMREFLDHLRGAMKRCKDEGLSDLFFFYALYQFSPATTLQSSPGFA
jgi:hypothetical protein